MVSKYNCATYLQSVVGSKSRTFNLRDRQICNSEAEFARVKHKARNSLWLWWQHDSWHVVTLDQWEVLVVNEVRAVRVAEGELGCTEVTHVMVHTLRRRLNSFWGT